MDHPNPKLPPRFRRWIVKFCERPQEERTPDTIECSLVHIVGEVKPITRAMVDEIFLHAQTPSGNILICLEQVPMLLSRLGIEIEG